MTRVLVPQDVRTLLTPLRHLKDKLRLWFEQTQPTGIKEKRWERISVSLAPLDILSWLHAQDILPKIFWQGRDSPFECAAIGEVYE